jgi:hypothetical protein
MDRDEMSNLYRGYDIDASYQVSVHLAKIFKNRPIRNNNGLWWPCLLMDRDKIFLAVFGEDLPYMLPTKFHFIWLRGFQKRRLKCEKLTDDRRRTPSDDKSSHCLWQGELKRLKLLKE